MILTASKPENELEKQVIERASAGDRNALSYLLVAYQPRLAGYIERHIPDLLRAESSVNDVLQNTFLEASKRITTFSPDGEEAVFRWLAVIARRIMAGELRVIRSIKRGGGFQRLAASDLSESVSMLIDHLAVYDRTPSRSAATNEAINALRGAVQELDAPLRDVLQYRYFDALSIRETATKMGKTEAAVHSLCYRALKALRQIMGSRSCYF